MKRLLVAVAAGVAMSAGLPGVAAADPTVDAAVTAFAGIPAMPKGTAIESASVTNSVISR